MFNIRATRVNLSYWLLVMQLLSLQQCLFCLQAKTDGEVSQKHGATPAPEAEEMSGEPAFDDAEILQFAAERAILNDPNRLSNVGIDGARQRIATFLTHGFNRFTAPARNYYNLIHRFMKWRTEYNKLQESYGMNNETNKPYLRDVLDVLRIEYSKIDKQLTEEACRGDRNDDGQLRAQKPRNQEENVDFIVKVLKMLIDHLEQRLQALKENGLTAALDERQITADAGAEAEIARAESTVKEASGRAKRIATKALVGVVANESRRIIVLMVLDKLATEAANTESPTSSAILRTLEPIIYLLGTAHSPLIVSYLASVRYSLIYKLLSFSASLFPCKMRPPQRQPSGPIPIATPIFPPEAYTAETSTHKSAKNVDGNETDNSD